MENNTTNFDRIEAYLLGQMPSTEVAAFEQEIGQDDTLAREVDRQRLEHRAMELLLREELRNNLQLWKAEEDKAGVASESSTGAKTVSLHASRRLIFRIAAAASIALLIGFFARQFFSGSTNYETLAMAQFDDTAVTIRGANDTDPFTPAYQAIAQKDYPAALIQLERVPKDYAPATVLNLRGECYFRLRQYSQAVATYQQLLQSKPADGDLREKAEWRLLLSYLAQGGPQAEVERLLDKVIAEGGQFADKAQQVRAEVK